MTKAIKKFYKLLAAEGGRSSDLILFTKEILHECFGLLLVENYDSQSIIEIKTLNLVYFGTPTFFPTDFRPQSNDGLNYLLAHQLTTPHLRDFSTVTRSATSLVYVS